MISEEVEKLVCVVLCCVYEESVLRLNMVIVVAMFEGKIFLGYLRSEFLNFLRFYGRRFFESFIIEDDR